MKVIPPLEITTARLTSSTAAEPSASETLWVSAGTYALGDQLGRATTHRIYEALQAHTGRTALPEVDTAYWLDVGPTNRWAMFDFERNSQTVQASPLTVVLTPAKRANSLALMGLDADSVTVSMTVGAVTVYSNTQSLINRHTTSWTEYFFGEFSYAPSLIFFDLPLHTSGVITIALTSARGAVKCGACVLGTSHDIGRAEYNAVSSQLNFDKVDRDAYGGSVLRRIRTVPKTSQSLFFEKDRVNAIRDLRQSLSSVPAVYSGLDDRREDGYFEALLILGIYKDWTINLAHPEHATAALTLEEI